MLKTKPTHLIMYLVCILIMAFFIYQQYSFLKNPGYDSQASYVTDLKDCVIVNDINCNVAFDIPSDIKVTSLKLLAINSSGEEYRFNGIDIFGRISKSVPMTKLGSISQFPESTSGIKSYPIPSQPFSTAQYQNRLIVSAHAKTPPNNLKIRLLLYSK